MKTRNLVFKHFNDSAGTYDETALSQRKIATELGDWVLEWCSKKDSQFPPRLNKEAEDGIDKENGKCKLLIDDIGCGPKPESVRIGRALLGSSSNLKLNLWDVGERTLFNAKQYFEKDPINNSSQADPIVNKLRSVETKNQIQVRYFQGDAEKNYPLHLVEQNRHLSQFQQSIIFSSSSLQWFEDLENFFISLNEVKQRGLLAVSMVIDSTFSNLKLLETKELNGQSISHKLRSLGEVREILSRAIPDQSMIREKLIRHNIDFSDFSGFRNYQKKTGASKPGEQTLSREVYKRLINRVKINPYNQSLKSALQKNFEALQLIYPALEFEEHNLKVLDSPDDSSTFQTNFDYYLLLLEL